MLRLSAVIIMRVTYDKSVGHSRHGNLVAAVHMSENCVRIASRKQRGRRDGYDR